MSKAAVTQKNGVRPADQDDARDAAEENHEAASPRRERGGPSPVLVFGMVLVLLMVTAAALIAFHPTAKARATALAAVVMRRGPAPGDQAGGKDSPTSEADALAAARAALALEQARLEALEADLAGREAGLAERGESVAASQSALDEQLAKHAALIADLNRLVRICQQMRPREAAELMEQLDDAQALTILLRLAETSAAQILAAMSRDRAAQLIKLMVPAGAG